MGEPEKKSFLPGAHLVITALAALTTALVAALGLAISQGWLGSSHNGNSGPGGSGGSSGGGAQFVVNPSSISFGPLTATTTAVSVTNIGSAALPRVSETVTGPQSSRFSVDPGSCTGSVAPGQNCQFQLIFHPVSGSSSATLVVQVSGGAPTEVPITASAIL